MTPQLEAITATRKQVEREAREGKESHYWDEKNCIFCKYHRPEDQIRTCSECPFFPINSPGCADFFTDEIIGEGSLIDYANTPIEYILSFLIDLESCYRDMED